MGLIYYLTIILGFFLHSTSSAQFVTEDQLTSEIMKFNDKISYLVEQTEKLKEKNLNLEEKNLNLENKIKNMKAKDSKLEQQMNTLNATVETKLKELIKVAKTEVREKMKEHVSELKVNLSQVDQSINWLNETVERVSNWTKINSNQIDSIRQCLNMSIKGCNKKDKATHPLVPTQPIINQNKCKITDMSQLYQLSPDTLVYTWKDLNASNVIQKKKIVMESDIFPVDKHGINAQLRITIFTDGGVSAELRFLRKQPSDIWTVKVYPRVTYVMKAKKKIKTINTYLKPADLMRFGASLRYNYNTYSYLRYFYYWKYSNNPELKYKVDDTFSMEVHVETPEMSNQFYSDNGTVKGTICPYQKIREWKNDQHIFWTRSPYFYTSPQGYRAVLQFYLSLDNFKTLNVWINILTGPYDSYLKKPKWKGTFILINQVDASKSVTQVEESDVLYPYISLYFDIPSNVSEFVVNDELRYEASIEILN